MCLTRVPLTLLCFSSFNRVNWTAAEHFDLWKSSVWSSSTCSTLGPTSAWLHMLWLFVCLYCLLQSTDRYYFEGNCAAPKRTGTVYTVYIDRGKRYRPGSTFSFHNDFTQEKFKKSHLKNGATSTIELFFLFLTCYFTYIVCVAQEE